MGNHSKCNGCGELDEFCVCRPAATSPGPTPAQIAAANEQCNNCSGLCGTCALELLPTPRPAAALEIPSGPLDVSASGLLKLWKLAQAAATPTMPAPFQFAKFLLAPRGPALVAPKPWNEDVPQDRNYADPRTRREEAMVAEIDAWRRLLPLARLPANAGTLAALKEARDTVLEEVARWLDWFDGKPTRRAEHVRSLKSEASRQNCDESTAAHPGNPHMSPTESPQAAFGDSAKDASSALSAEAIAEARRKRIVELRNELVALEAEQYGELDAKQAAAIEECRALKRAGKRIEATKLYRATMGCGLREAHDAVENMQ